MREAATTCRSIRRAALACVAALGLGVSGCAAQEGHSVPPLEEPTLEEPAVDPSPPAANPLAVPMMEWENPCGLLGRDLLKGVGVEELSARYGLPADATVPGLGTIVGYTCMSGSDTGVEAIGVLRRVGDAVYEDYIMADGAAGTDWQEWFASTQPDLEVHRTEFGWTTEPPGPPDGTPDRPVWELLPDVISKLQR